MVFLALLPLEYPQIVSILRRISPCQIFLPAIILNCFANLQPKRNYIKQAKKQSLTILTSLHQIDLLEGQFSLDKSNTMTRLGQKILA